MAAGRCQLVDKVGNACADKLDGLGADGHDAVIELEEAATNRLELAKQVQTIMLGS